MPVTKPNLVTSLNKMRLSFDHFLCSFIDNVVHKMKVHVFISHVILSSRLDHYQCKNPPGTLLNVSWKSPGNLLGWIY